MSKKHAMVKTTHTFIIVRCLSYFTGITGMFGQLTALYLHNLYNCYSYNRHHILSDDKTS